ncbi:glycosyltransferase [Virgibacillus sp. CM-4]|uniref:glycosyltransferase n=1 Tax=Virgibacillus sp. CM-4 TaxID=1354277 RepID=UPI0018C9EE84|nr:glycosyltransferase [Virgibacillus sp. CM-4]
MMKKNVCMFVWNHFTNDARVLRECTSLSGRGYNVDLICIDDPSDETLKKQEKINENFQVFRVRRYPVVLETLQKLYKNSIKHKSIGAILLLIWLFFLLIFPYFTGFISIFFLVLLKTKLKVVMTRGSIFLRMILKGSRSHYDIYHANDLNTLPQGYVCSKLRFKRKKLVYDSHEVQTSRTGYDSNYYRYLEGLLIKRIDTMIVENHTRAKYNQDLYGFYPHVLHNYPFVLGKVENEKININEKLGLFPEEKILLYQGGIQAGRGLEKLIEAVPSFNEGTLVLIGDGRIKPQLEKMVEDLELQDRVKFLPKVPLSDLPKYTQNAYLGFQVLNNTNFNHYSASSNKLFEYMMSDIPVIACSFPEIQKIVEGEGTGVCVDSHDYKSIALGVNYLLDNPSIRKQMAVNCSKAKLKYNWRNEQNILLDIYNES